LGTGKIADGEEHACGVHLPFAGITLFRFYGCNLSLLYRSTPGNSFDDWI